ncbi:hypothetical protein N9D83_06460 [Amylibacter sp.]|nr:hypothetical protein [Amylibacter sp.]
MYLNIEELAEKLSVSVSSIGNWLEAGYFSNEAYFNINNVCRFDLDKVRKELHSENFGKKSVADRNMSHTDEDLEIPEVNKILLDDYKHLTCELLKIISSNMLIPKATSFKLSAFEQNFLSGYDIDYATSSLQDAVDILKKYNLKEVVASINQFILSKYTDDDDRRALLDTIGIFGDLSKVQNDMQEKLNKYISYEDESREKMLEHMGVDYDSLLGVLSDEESILEAIEETMTKFSESIAQSEEKTELVTKMRKSFFSKYYNFETYSFNLLEKL